MKWVLLRKILETSANQLHDMKFKCHNPTLHPNDPNYTKYILISLRKQTSAQRSLNRFQKFSVLISKLRKAKPASQKVRFSLKRLKHLSQTQGGRPINLSLHWNFPVSTFHPWLSIEDAAAKGEEKKTQEEEESVDWPTARDTVEMRLTMMSTPETFQEQKEQLGDYGTTTSSVARWRSPICDCWSWVVWKRRGLPRLVSRWWRWIDRSTGAVVAAF